MTKIYYFSGTGNTLWSAREILKILGEGELHNMGAEEGKEKKLEGDAVVFLFPAYAYGAPPLVRRFIRDAEIHAPYTAALVTFGTEPGGALAQVGALLRRKTGGPSFFGRIPAVENYIPLFGPPAARTVAKRLALQEAATEAAALAIRERRTSRPPALPPLSALVSLLFSGGRRLFYRRYRLGPSCSGCGLCARLCPAGAIMLREGRPVFTARCEHCQACLNWCPQKAITFGRLRPDTPRYHHPGIFPDDMLRELKT